MNNKTRVVIADDQNISRGFFEMYVRAAVGYELVAGLRTAGEAVEFLDENEADLLILDVMMQEGIDGITAAQMIKERHPKVKIILTTSASETSWEDKARKIGVESFWYKEYDEHGIQEIMDRTMNGERVYPGDQPKIFLELLLFFVAEPFNLPRFYNSPELRIFGMLAIFEVCIRSRLILYNENYFGFFAGLNQPVLITDRSIRHVFQTALPIEASEEALRSSVEAPVYLNEDTKLCGMELGAGYAFWTEDETQLHKENRRLEAANEFLSQENELIEVENKLKEKKSRLDAESAIYIPATCRVCSTITVRQTAVRA